VTRPTGRPTGAPVGTVQVNRRNRPVGAFERDGGGPSGAWMATLRMSQSTLGEADEVAWHYNTAGLVFEDEAKTIPAMASDGGQLRLASWHAS
jgi:hypothetical protein